MQFTSSYNEFVEYRDIITRLLRLARVSNWNEDNAFGSYDTIKKMMADLGDSVKSVD